MTDCGNTLRLVRRVAIRRICIRALPLTEICRRSVMGKFNGDRHHSSPSISILRARCCRLYHLVHKRTTISFRVHQGSCRPYIHTPNFRRGICPPLHLDSCQLHTLQMSLAHFVRKTLGDIAQTPSPVQHGKWCLASPTPLQTCDCQCHHFRCLCLCNTITDVRSCVWFQIPPQFKHPGKNFAVIFRQLETHWDVRSNRFAVVEVEPFLNLEQAVTEV